MQVGNFCLGQLQWRVYVFIAVSDSFVFQRSTSSCNVDEVSTHCCIFLPTKSAFILFIYFLIHLQYPNNVSLKELVMHVLAHNTPKPQHYKQGTPSQCSENEPACPTTNHGSKYVYLWMFIQYVYLVMHVLNSESCFEPT